MDFGFAQGPRTAAVILIPRWPCQNLSLAKFLAGVVLLWPVAALATVGVPFEAGFIGEIGNNSQKANNIQTFSTLDIDRAIFSQSTTGSGFALQGNDIPGTLTFVLLSDQTVVVDGAIVWRFPNGAQDPSFGFIPASDTNVSFSYGNGSTFTVRGSDFDTSQTPASNIGLRNMSPNVNYNDGTVDGSNVNGNAATNGLLTALNDYLDEAQQAAPDNSISVVSQTTTDTTPIITGTLSSPLATGESLEIIVNGEVYDGGNVTVQGTIWSIQVLVAIPLGTYDVTASIIDSDGFSIEDGTNSELVIVDVVTYSIGGTIVDLSDSGTLILANSDGQQLTINGPANSFVFPTALADGSGYSVSVAQQPDGQRCVVKRKQGTISGAAVDDIEVKCLELNINSGGSSGGVNNSSCAGLKSQSSRFKVPDNPPANFDFPYGVFEFRAEECDVGATIEIVLQFPQALPSDTKHWKLINGTWEDWTNRVSIVGNKITFSITDGGEGDTDGEANGVIVDPSGPGMPSSVTVQSYSVSANAGTGGSAACTPNPVTSGGSSTCTATPDTGYEFDSWTGDCAGESATCSLSNITSDQSSTASFTALTYSVSATAGTGGNASCSPSSVNYNGSSTCTATPNGGYEFDSWTGDCAGEGATCSLSNISGNISVEASFSDEESTNTTDSNDNNPADSVNLQAKPIPASPLWLYGLLSLAIILLGRRCLYST